MLRKMFAKLYVLFLFGVPLIKLNTLAYHLKREFIENLGFYENGVSDDYEIIFLPEILPKREAIGENAEETDEILMEFDAFGRTITMNLKENHKLLSKNLKTYIHDGNNLTVIPNVRKSCFLLHKDLEKVASINYCAPTLITGFIFLDDATLEITPVSKEFKKYLQHKKNLLELDGNIPYIIRKIPHTSNRVRNEIITYEQKETFTVEVAVFFDESAYNIFAPYLSYSEEKMQDMLLAYLNGVQALYHHPTLEGSLEVVVVRMDIFKKQPEDLLVFKGESNPLLDSFCLYQNNLNLDDDSDPNHWDMGLYISGLDFFTYDKKGNKDYGTMGLSTVGGVCHGKYSCVIAEFGSTNVFGKPYPTAGFTSVYVLAHEIGHNLGMHHDGTKNNCPTDGFIMSASRGTTGETHWSKCSAEVMQKLYKKKCLQDDGETQYNHSVFLESPGRWYTPKKQCEVFLADKDAYEVENQENICQDLKCKTPHRSGHHFAGPALDGTQCGSDKFCYAGECKQSTDSSRTITDDQLYKRKCNDKACYDHAVLCKDVKVCSERTTIIDHTSQRCRSFSHVIFDLDTKGVGLQLSYEPENVRLACLIFCRRKDGTYYSPRMELDDIGISPYLPDGMWCHKENGRNYYCLDHRCLPDGLSNEGVHERFYTSPRRSLLNYVHKQMSIDEERTLNHNLLEDES